MTHTCSSVAVVVVGGRGSRIWFIHSRIHANTHTEYIQLDSYEHHTDSLHSQSLSVCVFRCHFPCGCMSTFDRYIYSIHFFAFSLSLFRFSSIFFLLLSVFTLSVLTLGIHIYTFIRTDTIQMDRKIECTTVSHSGECERQSRCRYVCMSMTAVHNGFQWFIYVMWYAMILYCMRTVFTTNCIQWESVWCRHISSNTLSLNSCQNIKDTNK